MPVSVVVVVVVVVDDDDDDDVVVDDDDATTTTSAAAAAATLLATSLTKVCDTIIGNTRVASAQTLTGFASTLILPQDTASSGLAPILRRLDEKIR